MTFIEITDDDMQPYPHADSLASKLLAEALDTVWNNDRLSQRRLAAKLGYKTSVPLSHMALGRIPIPIDRVSALAKILPVNEAKFLLAVLEQRHPQIEFRRLLKPA